jgi:hypothetical protein
VKAWGFDTSALRVIYVFTENHVRADRWMREHELSPRDVRVFGPGSRRVLGMHLHPADRVVMLGFLDAQRSADLHRLIRRSSPPPRYESYDRTVHVGPR